MIKDNTIAGKYGKALAVLRNAEEAHDEDIREAIETILSMATINAVTKDMLLNALRWCYAKLYEEGK